MPDHHDPSDPNHVCTAACASPKPSMASMAKGAVVLGIAIGALGAGCPTNDPQPAYGVAFDDDDSAMDDDDASDDDDSAMGG